MPIIKTNLIFVKQLYKLTQILELAKLVCLIRAFALRAHEALPKILDQP